MPRQEIKTLNLNINILHHQILRILMTFKTKIKPYSILMDTNFLMKICRIKSFTLKRSLQNISTIVVQLQIVNLSKRY